MMSPNTRIAVICVAVIARMAGLSYASVPLYPLFCQVTGYGGTVQKAEIVDGVPILDRTINVRFDANTASSLNWDFRPEQREVTVRLGERMQINYIAENQSNEPVVGTATFNVTPQTAGVFFNKIECFCFTDTRIEPGGRLEMPVVFFVDPELDHEKLMKSLKTITLSYTFFESDEEPQANKQVKLGENPSETEDQKL